MPVKNQSLLLTLLLSITPAAFPATQPIFATDDPAPGPIDPGYQSPPWPEEADAQGTASGSPLDRWSKQADGGRARAAAISGRYWLERVPENPGENCAKAIEWFNKADKLGSNEAATWLGHLYRRFDCPQRNVKTAITWLEKAVPLMTFGAAADLSALFSAADAPERDPVRALAYGRIAAQANEFPADDPESPGRVATLEHGLDAGQKRAANELADKLLAIIGQRRALLTAAPRAEKLRPVAKGPGWTANLIAYDALRECTANTTGNCKGVRRLAYLQAANQGNEYLRCKFELDHRDFATAEKTTNERDTLLPPKSTRNLYFGKVGEVGGNEDLRVTCKPVAALAANVAAGKCRVTTTGVPSVSDFYPPGAKRRGEEGRVVVYVLLDKKEGQPSLVELKDSSGFGELDVAGVKMGTYMAFKGDCDVGYSSVAISFRLQD